MSERITQELRDAMTAGVGLIAFNGNVLEETLCVLRTDFESRCDAIDAVHANLERENDRLKCELDRVLGESDDVPESKGHVISHVTVEVTPHIDWSRMADEVDEFVQIVRGMAGDAE